MGTPETLAPMEEDDDDDDEDGDDRIQCLVAQGLTPALARHVILAKSRDSLPLTIWIVENSSSMLAEDGKRLVETSSTTNVSVLPCTRWAELQETVRYHAQLAALLQAPTKFILLNDPQTGRVANPSSSRSSSSSSSQSEWSIAERGSDWISADLDLLLHSFSTLVPSGVTPLTLRLRRIYYSLQNMKEKIVLVVATDGRPTDSSGYTSPIVDRDFEQALRQVSTKAWIVIRLCTNDDSILKYYQQLDDKLEEGFSIDVLDDYLDEAKEIQENNPWLTYSLGLHRCREMGMSCHSIYKWLDWLDERPLTRTETLNVIETLGVISDDAIDAIDPTTRALLDEAGEWKQFCGMVERQQQEILLANTKQRLEVPGNSGNASGSGLGNAYLPWNPIQRKPTSWIDMNQLRRHTGKKARPWWTTTTSQWWVILTVVVLVLAELLR